MLDRAQHNAVQSNASTILVIAGPGSGKTHTLVMRIVHTIQQGVHPSQILAVTFTHKAATEMAERVGHMLRTPKSPIIQTLHAWCFNILHIETGTLPLLIDEHTQAEIISDICKHQGIAKVQDTTRQLSLYKASPTPSSQLPTAIRPIIDAYTARLHENNWIDFDDLILHTIRLFQNDPAILQKYQNQFSHVLVDEYQDLNKAQQALILLLSERSSLFVIGDPLQTIYGFRGANTHGFEELRTARPNAHRYTLANNYRSCKEILTISQQLFPNSSSQLATRQSVGHIGLYTTPSDKAEAQFITDTIHRLIGGIRRQDYDTGAVESNTEGAFTFGDIAILVRSRSQMDVIKKALVHRGLPVTISPITMNSNEQTLSALNSLNGIQPSTLVFNTSLVDLVRKSFDAASVDPATTTLFAREARILETGDIQKDLPFFLELSKLILRDPDTTYKTEKIYVMTIHASKGLEWPVVFLPGLEERVLPHMREGEATDFDEERRLAYVAMTRAKDHLYLSCAANRTIYGTHRVMEASRFTRDLKGITVHDCTKPIKPKMRPVQKRLF